MLDINILNMTRYDRNDTEIANMTNQNSRYCWFGTKNLSQYRDQYREFKPWD